MHKQKEKTLGDFIFGSLLDFWDSIPECPYCGDVMADGKSFCNDQCESEFFQEDELKEKKEENNG